MSTPSASSEDRAEQDTPLVREPQQDAEVPLEAGPADVAEQTADTGAQAPPTAPAVPLEADPADAAEQSAVLEPEDDERR